MVDVGTLCLMPSSGCATNVQNPDVEITEVIFAWRAWWENCSLQGSLIFFGFKSFLRRVDIALDSEGGSPFVTFVLTKH